MTTTTRRSERRRRLARAPLAAVVAGLLLAGCASMPSSGGLSKVEHNQSDDQGGQVRVFGVRPQPGESPDQLVTGFLEATTSNEVDQRTAKDYLTKQRAARWKPDQRIVVLSGGMHVVNRATEDYSKITKYTVSMAGTRIATVDSQHAYTPTPDGRGVPFHVTFTLVKNSSGQWRIDKLPNGMILNQTDFQRIYEPVALYYPSNAGQSGGWGSSVVPDPVYLRRPLGQGDLIAQTAQALTAGPSHWLSPVVGNAFPQGTTVVDKSVTPGDDGTVTLRIHVPTKRTPAAQCRMMATQLLFSLRGETPSVDKVELQTAKGHAMCDADRSTAGGYDPTVSQGDSLAYFVDSGGRLVSAGVPQQAGASADGSTEESGGSHGADHGSSHANRVPGPLGAGSHPIRSAGVRYDQRKAAVVGKDGRQLYVTSIAPETLTTAPIGAPLVTSNDPKASTATGGLSTPSWDGQNDLWVVDRASGTANRLLLVPAGTKQPQAITVPVNGLKAGERLEGVRVAADGLRIALLVGQGSSSRILLGLVRTQANAPTRGQSEVTVDDLRVVSDPGDDVTAMAWAGPTRMVELGKSGSGPQRLQYVESDGSYAYSPSVQTFSGMTDVAASEAGNLPLLTDSTATVASSHGHTKQVSTVYRLRQDSEWQSLQPAGTAPFYPG